QLFDQSGKFRGGLHIRLRRLGEMVLRDRAFKDRAVRAHPNSAPRQFRRDVGNHIAIGRDSEADELRFLAHLARDDALPFAHRLTVLFDGHRQIQASSSLAVSSSATSSSTTSGSSSIQPIFTRAFMMMALASSAVRLKPSRKPGTRMRSFSLLVS